MPLEHNIRELFTEGAAITEASPKLLEIIPKLNHDQLVDLALYLAFETKINDK